MEERFMQAGAVQPDERKELDPRLAFLLGGLKRFAIFTAGAAVLSGGVGLVAGWLTGNDLARYLTLGLYVGGGVLIAFAVFSFSSADRHWVGELGEDLGTSEGGDTAALIAVGLAVAGIGLLVDWLLA